MFDEVLKCVAHDGSDIDIESVLLFIGGVQFQSRTPPSPAASSSLRIVSAGNVVNRLELPPPSATYSTCNASFRCSIISKTFLVHFFSPSLFRAAAPTSCSKVSPFL